MINFGQLTAEEKRKVEMGVRVLRESLKPLYLDVELVCQAGYVDADGRERHYACNVAEPYGFAPEASCPIHDAWEGPDD